MQVTENFTGKQRVVNWNESFYAVKTRIPTLTLINDTLLFSAKFARSLAKKTETVDPYSASGFIDYKSTIEIQLFKL